MFELGAGGLGNVQSRCDIGWGHQKSRPTLLCHSPGACPCPSPGNGVSCSSSGIIGSPEHPKSASSRSRALSQQHQFPITNLPRARRILWKAPTTSTKDPEPALPAEDTGSRQRALLPLGEFSSHHRIRWESRVAQSPSQSCPMAQIRPRWIWSHGEQAAPEDSRATITVIRNGGSGLADPAGILSCFMGGQIAGDVQGPLLCPILSAGMCWHTQSSAQPHSHLPLVMLPQVSSWAHLCSHPPHSCSGIHLSGSSGGTYEPPMAQGCSSFLELWEHLCPPFVGDTGNGKEWDPPLQIWDKPTHTPLLFPPFTQEAAPRATPLPTIVSSDRCLADPRNHPAGIEKHKLKQIAVLYCK